MEFKNPTLTTEQLPQYQDVELSRIDKKYKAVIIWQWIILLLVLIGINLLMSLDPGLSKHLYIAIGASAMIALLWIVLQLTAFKRRSYTVREQDIIYRHGLISVITTVIPYKRIQHIAVAEGVLLRVYQLATIQIYTAGGGSGDLKLKGLPREEATRIKDFILSKIK